jgi:hypothetical protein
MSTVDNAVGDTIFPLGVFAGAAVLTFALSRNGAAEERARWAEADSAAAQAVANVNALTAADLRAELLDAMAEIRALEAERADLRHDVDVLKTYIRRHLPA